MKTKHEKIVEITSKYQIYDCYGNDKTEELIIAILEQLEPEGKMSGDDLIERFQKETPTISRVRNLEWLQVYATWLEVKLIKKLTPQQPSDSAGEECPNCKETGEECACARNKCNKCGKPVGNITFTVCDECWDKEYSAGEEVYVEWSDEELKNNRYPIALYVTDEHLGQEIPVKRTTRPTVSEEEISDLIHDAMLRNYNSKQLAKKIMELLNR